MTIPPEIRGKCQKEKDLAKEARNLVRGLFENAQTITLSIDDNPKEVRGKYFRIVGRLIADGVDISDLLIHRLNPDGSLNTATDRLKDPL